jgi:hypothetical protein
VSAWREGTPDIPLQQVKFAKAAIAARAEPAGPTAWRRKDPFCVRTPFAIMCPSQK